MRYCNSCGAENPSDSTSCFACQHSLLESASTIAKSVSGPLVLSDAGTLLHNRYRKLAQVGTGGFGAVYKAEDIQGNNRVVALKEINIGGLQSRQVIDATNTYNREVELLAMLAHPNLPRIYEHFTDAEHWYVIMDFIEGQTLEQQLLDRGGHLPLEEVFAIGIQLCDVLDYLHTRQPPIIFRDLKPANIMLTTHKQVYLIDFGSARFFKPGKPKDTIAFGSPGYAAPEQYGKAQTTARSDLYSLGATLHQLLTGYDPSDTPFSFPALQLAGASFPPELEPLILSMVSLDATKRPESAQKVKHELQQLSLQHPRRLYPNTLYTMGAKGLSQSFISTASQPLPPSPPSEWAIQAPSVQQAQQMLGIPVTNNAKQNSFSRRAVVTGLVTTVLTASFFGVSALFNHSVRHSEPGSSAIISSPQLDSSFQSQFLYTYTGHHDAITAVGWNKTNTRIASASADGTTQVWDYNTGQHVLFYKGHKGQVNAFSWSPDGKHIASVDIDGTLRVWDAQHGTTITTYNIASDAGAFTDVAWSPDGTHIAVASRIVQLLDLKTAIIGILYVNTNSMIPGLSWSQDGAKVAIGNNNESIYIYNLKNNSFSKILNMPAQTAISALTWVGTDNELLALGENSYTSDTYKVMLWDTIANTQSPTSILELDSPISSIASTQNSSRLAVIGNDTQIRVWNIDANSYGSYNNHTSTVRTVAWSRDGKMIASGGDDKTVQVWKPQ